MSGRPAADPEAAEEPADDSGADPGSDPESVSPAQQDAEPVAAEPEAPEPEPQYGRLGATFDRHSPFYFGFFAGLGALVAWFLFMALVGIGSQLMLVVVALFLAAGLNPSVEFLERHGLRRAWAVTVVIFAALGAIALFVVALVPVITDQVAALTEQVPTWLDQLQENQRIQELDEKYDVIGRVREYVEQGNLLSGIFGGVLGVGLRILAAVFNAVIILVLTLYFLSSLEVTKSAFYRLAPASRRPRVEALGDRVIHNVGAYVSGAFIVAMIAGLSTLVLLLIIGLGEYAVALAFVVAVLTIIPMIGGTLGGVIVSAVAFATDVRTGFICVVFFIVYQQVENYLIYPRVMRRAGDLPGAVIVIAALVGAALLGIVGALLAIPTAAAILLIMREVVVQRQDTR